MTWHMLKSRERQEVTTRCGLVLRVRSGQYLPDIEVTSSERRITCPDCHLPRKDPHA